MPKYQKTSKKQAKGNNTPYSRAARRPLASKQGRRFVFTHNNYSKTSKKLWNEFDCTYIIYGEEIAPTTGTPHLQGYIETTRKMAISTILRVFKQPPAGAARAEGKLLIPHVAFANGNAESNKRYCSKGKNVFEKGTPMQQGVSSSLQGVVNDIVAGKYTAQSLLLSNAQMYHQYKHTFREAENVFRDTLVRPDAPKVHWYWGSTGTGKTHTAYSKMEGEVFRWTNDKGWWDKYKGQPNVLIDEFRGEIDYSLLLQLLDKYPVSVIRRGQEPTPFLAKNIFITSALTPTECYPGLDSADNINQLLRRITEVKEFKIKYNCI